MPPIEHAWTTALTCEVLVVINTSKSTCRRSLEVRQHRYSDNAWLASLASFECYDSVTHDEVEMICTHLLVKVAKPRETDEVIKKLN